MRLEIISKGLIECNQRRTTYKKVILFCYFSVRLEVAVKEANFDPVPNARVILMLGDKGMTATTDSNGRAPFALR